MQKSVVFSMHAKSCFKAIVVGNKNAGKTSLIVRFVKGTFDFNYKVTIGVEFYSKVISQQGEEIAIQIWDTAGSDNCKSVARSFYNFAQCVIIVYESCMDLEENIENWMREIKENAQDAARLVLVRTKIDMVPIQSKQSQKVNELLQKYSIDFFMPVSARTDQNVSQVHLHLNQLFHKICAHLNHLYQTDPAFQRIMEPKNESIVLDPSTAGGTRKSLNKAKCCN